MSDLISRKAILEHIEKTRQDALMMDDIRTGSLIMYGIDLCEKAVGVQPSAQPVITCDGCKFVGTYDTDFPCRNCIRREKDYYAQE